MPTAPLDTVWRVYVRDVNGATFGELGDWLSGSVRLVFNNVGTFLFEISNDSAIARYMDESKGILITRNDVTVFSGRIFSEFTRTANTIRFGGVSDDYLLWAPALPDPYHPLAPQTAYNVVTSTASTVMLTFVKTNIGDLSVGSAEAIARQVPNLAFATDPAVGGSLTGRGGGQKLVSLLRELAATSIAGGLGFHVIQTSVTGTRTFRVYQPQDRSSIVKFARHLGTITDFTDTKAAPEYTFVYVQGGDGLGADNRTVLGAGDLTAMANWGRIEGIIVETGVTDPSELNQKLAEAVASIGTSRKTTVTPFETQKQQFVDHWYLGDLVTFEVIGPGGVAETRTDLIREIQIDFTADKGVVVTPMIGDAAASNDNIYAQHISSVEARMGNIERNWTVPNDSLISAMFTAGAVDAHALAANAVTEPKLDIIDAPANHEVLGYDTSIGRMVWLGLGEIAGSFVNLTTTGNTILGDDATTDALTVNAQSTFNGPTLYKGLTQFANASSTVVASFDPTAGAQTVLIGTLATPGLYYDAANARVLIGTLSPLGTAPTDRFTVAGGISYFAGASGPAMGWRWNASQTDGWSVGLSASGSSALLNFYDQSAGVILQAGPTGAGLQFRVFGDTASARLFLNATGPNGSELFRVASGTSRLEGKLTVTTSGIDITGASVLRNAVSFLAGGVDIHGGLEVNGGLTGFDNTFDWQSSGNSRAKFDSTGVGFFGASTVGRQTVVGSRAANAALQSLCTALANLGLITDLTT